MINKLNHGKVNGDSEELHALKGFKVLAVGNGTIGEECALKIMLMNENNVAVDLSITEEKKIELNAELSKCFVLSDRDLKYKVIFNFIDVASHYLFDYNNIDLYSKLISAHSECIAIGFSWGDFEGYMQYVKPPNENFSLTDHAIEQMQYSLTSISKKFNDLLIHSLNSALIE